jgi:hypothetical protein
MTDNDFKSNYDRQLKSNYDRELEKQQPTTNLGETTNLSFELRPTANLLTIYCNNNEQIITTDNELRKQRPTTNLGETTNLS